MPKVFEQKINVLHEIVAPRFIQKIRTWLESMKMNLDSKKTEAVLLTNKENCLL